MKAEIEVAEGKITYSVLKDGKTIVSPSEVSMQMTDGSAYDGSAKLRKAVRATVDNMIASPFYKKAQVKENFNQISLIFKTFDLEFRAFDAGIAYRFVSKSKDAFKVKGEKAEFVFPEDWNMYVPYVKDKKPTLEEQFYNSFENLYVYGKLSSWDKERIAFLPLMVEGPDGIKVSTRDKDMLDNDLVWLLGTPADAQTDWSWVKPGKVAWEWWNDWNVSKVPFRAGCNTATYEYYIDFAQQFGIEYVIMDEGWSKELQIMELNPETDVPHLVKYANARGVGIILWCAWPQLVGRQHEVFSKYANMGVKGFKIDFMDRDDQEMELYLEETAKIAAEYKLLIDYHGMHKPTGMSRTYPNILNYEGIHGLECTKWEDGRTDFMRNDLLGLYCRMSAGPMDYTPGAMINMARKQIRASLMQPGSQGTRVHQMALMALYEAPLQMLCDSPTQYLRNRECFEFMAKVPVVWDETIGLPGEMEKSAAIARRKGDAWYVAAINSWEPCTMEIDTSFLGDGKWRAEIFADGLNADRDATDYVKKSESFKAGEKIKIELAPGGGWIARFVRRGFLW